MRTTTIEDWDRIHAINLRAPFFLMQAAVPHLERQGGGAILNIGSINAYIGEPKLTAYSSAKGGLMTLTKNAAAQLNAAKIRVNQINVGWTLTEGEEKVKREQEGKGDEWVAEAVNDAALRPPAGACRHGLRGRVLCVGCGGVRDRLGDGPRAVSRRRAARLVGTGTGSGLRTAGLQTAMPR